MKIKNKLKTSGFTLIELLIVGLIIGILTSVALPMYKKAAERSKATEALSTLTAVAKSEHDFFLTKNKYTKDFGNLDIDLTDKNGNKAEDEAFKSQYYDYELLDNGIIAERNNGEYTIYRDYDSGQIMCTPGTHFICENLGKFEKESCNKIGMAWANRDSTCYVDEETRCKTLYPNNNFWNGSFCNYSGNDGDTIQDGLVCTSFTCNDMIIDDGGICIASNRATCYRPTINYGGICYPTINGYYNCNNATINYGGICDGNGHSTCQNSTVYNGGICKGNGSDGCQSSTIKTGGICEGNVEQTCKFVKVESGGLCIGNTANSCINSTFYPGGKCRALADGSCLGGYQGTGAASACCEGTYCPSDAPRCECPNHEKKDSEGNCIS